MVEREYSVPEGILYYTEKDGEVEILRFHGPAGSVSIPECMEGKPVTSLAKKAFLSKKNLRSVRLPATLRLVGDWAFAYCSALKDVSLECPEVSFGKSVFMECPALEQIRIPLEQGMQKEQGIQNGISHLLAAAVTGMESAYLLDPAAAGQPEWLQKWDARLETILNAPDREGYSKQVLCGEEDYGSTNLESYLSGRRKAKVRLALLRLLYPVGLDGELARRLQDYLRSMAKGCETEETWQVIRKEHGDHREYYELYVRIGCLTPENLVATIADVGEDFPEMKAYFLSAGNSAPGSGALFDELEL